MDKKPVGRTFGHSSTDFIHSIPFILSIPNCAPDRQAVREKPDSFGTACFANGARPALL
jgi:hypothetical protein